MRGWGHVADIERFDVGGMIEHVGELRSELLELLRRDVNARQPGDVRDLVRGQPLRHATEAKRVISRSLYRRARTHPTREWPTQRPTPSSARSARSSRRSR